MGHRLAQATVEAIDDAAFRVAVIFRRPSSLVRYTYYSRETHMLIAVLIKENATHDTIEGRELDLSEGFEGSNRGAIMVRFM